MQRLKIILVLIASIIIILIAISLYNSNKRLNLKVDKLQSDNLILQQKINDLNSEAETIKNSIDYKFTTFKSINPDITKLNASISTLKNKNSDLESQLEKLYSEYSVTSESIENSSKSKLELCKKRESLGYPCK